eukprot:scaffold990_cov108-Cylindrotheca_fusiformis.AAC.4
MDGHDHSGHDMGGMDGMDGMGNETAFCTGSMGMVMYMDGFRWSLKEGASCLNLYFPGWTLDTKGKVVGAMFGVLFLAMFTEAISKFRHTLSTKARNVSTSQKERKKLAVAQTLLHGLHAFVGYIVMLATMTFSLELLICVVLGLTFGYVIFGGEKYNHISTNPCCAFLEDEAQERGPREGPEEEDHDCGCAPGECVCEAGECTGGLRPCCDHKGDVESTPTDEQRSEATTDA